MHGSGCRHISTKARLPHHCPQETERRTHVAAGVSAELAALQVNPGLSVATGIHNWSEDHPVSFIHSDPDGGGAGAVIACLRGTLSKSFGNKKRPSMARPKTKAGNVRFRLLCGLKSDISRGPRSARNGLMRCNKRGVLVGYSITSVAPAISLRGTVRPSARAVLRLMNR